MTPSVALIGAGNGSFGACAKTHAPIMMAAATIRMTVIPAYYCFADANIYLALRRRSIPTGMVTASCSRSKPIPKAPISLRHDLSDHAVPLIKDEDSAVRTFAVSHIGARRRLFTCLDGLRLHQIQQRLRLSFVIEHDAANRVLAAIGRQFVDVNVKQLARRVIAEQQQ